MPDQGDRKYANGPLGDLWTADYAAASLAAFVASVADFGTSSQMVSSDPVTASTGLTLPDINASAAGQEIVFIDGAIPDAQILAEGVKAGVRAVILDASHDGVDQIAAWLASHDAQNLAAIAIVSHGADGVLFLGSAVLDAGTIAQYQAQLAQIGSALQPGGGLLLYGCDVAQDAAGVAFIDQLSAATGGANIAASSHLVGAAD